MNKSKITKAVIPVAGLGTRMLPATKAIPKEMLPVVDKPVIQYIVNECAKAGITEIILVTHASKNSIENHFDTSFELEATLESRVKRQLLDEVQSICPHGVTIMHVRQGIAKGLGHAVLCAKPLVGNEPFAVVLPDVIVDDGGCDLTKDNLAHMLNLYSETQANQIMVDPVPQKDVSKFGIANVAGKDMQPGDSEPMSEIIEKPSLEQAPSNLAVTGRYVLSEEIWDILATTPPGAGNEIQLTDAIAQLMKTKPVNAYLLKGKKYDCGSKSGYLQAIVDNAMRHPEVAAEFKQYITDLVTQ